jgi:glucokinase
MRAKRRRRRATGRRAGGTERAHELEVVVIGGGVAQAGEVLLGPLRACIEASPGLAFVRRVRVYLTRLPGTAGLLGAAAAAAARSEGLN